MENNFTFTPLGIFGIILVEPKVHIDERGFLMETWSDRHFKTAGYGWKFVQDNHSYSRKGVLRGLHFQKKHSQGKLLRVIIGEIFDVAVDIRRASPTFGKWFGTILSADSKKMLYIPEGFAHGFLTLSETAECIYKTTDFYYPGDEGCIRWDDPKIGIKWPKEGLVITLSQRDATSTMFINDVP